MDTRIREQNKELPLDDDSEKTKSLVEAPALANKKDSSEEKKVTNPADLSLVELLDYLANCKINGNKRGFANIDKVYWSTLLNQWVFYAKNQSKKTARNVNKRRIAGEMYGKNPKISIYHLPGILTRSRGPHFAFLTEIHNKQKIHPFIKNPDDFFRLYFGPQDRSQEDIDAYRKMHSLSEDKDKEAVKQYVKINYSERKKKKKGDKTVKEQPPKETKQTTDHHVGTKRKLAVAFPQSQSDVRNIRQFRFFHVSSELVSIEESKKPITHGAQQFFERLDAMSWKWDQSMGHWCGFTCASEAAYYCHFFKNEMERAKLPVVFIQDQQIIRVQLRNRSGEVNATAAHSAQAMKILVERLDIIQSAKQIPGLASPWYAHGW